LLGAQLIPENIRDFTAAFSGPLGAHQVSVTTMDVPVDDHVSLSTAIYRPDTSDPVATLLVRTPYAKEQLITEGTFWASHGYCVVVQDTRGPASYFDEANDGEATVKWIKTQDWYNGHLGLHGMSYLSFTALATASRCKDDVDAITFSYFSSDRVSSWYPGGSIGLEVALAWSASQDKDPDEKEKSLGGAGPKAELDAYTHLPLIDADKVQSGKEIPFFRERLSYWGDDPHWQPLDFSHVLSEGCPPTLLFGGWYDYQRKYLWEDFGRLRHAGVPHRLVMGAWMHGGGLVNFNAEALRWFDTYVRQLGNETQLPLSFYVTGRESWQEVAEWPESAGKAQQWYLAPDGQLTSAPSVQVPPSTFSYDPTDPTPSVGLAAFDATRAMPCDNRELEARSDVITFTGDVLDEPLELFGPVSATLWVTSSAESADFFVRLTDVHPDGASHNVIDALQRVQHDQRLHSGGEPLQLDIELGPCAHFFDTGHCLRVQISSGAFPFYARNLGTGEDVATGTRVVVATQSLFHDSVYPSQLTATLGKNPT